MCWLLRAGAQLILSRFRAEIMKVPVRAPSILLSCKLRYHAYNQHLWRRAYLRQVDKLFSPGFPKKPLNHSTLLDSSAPHAPLLWSPVDFGRLISYILRYDPVILICLASDDAQYYVLKYPTKCGISNKGMVIAMATYHSGQHVTFRLLTNTPNGGPLLLCGTP